MDNFTTENEIKILTQELDYLLNEEDEINRWMDQLRDTLNLCSNDEA